MDRQLKNIVIVGALSGAHVARALESTLPSTHRIVLIDANKYAYWPIAALRASVTPGYETKVVEPLANFFPSNSRHIVLAGYRVIEIKDGSIRLDKAAPTPFLSTEIAVDIGVIATGTNYALPMCPHEMFQDDTLAALRTMQQNFKAAKRIVPYRSMKVELYLRLPASTCRKTKYTKVRSVSLLIQF